ncbi:ferritin family protein [Chloroflexota bacterium]
MGVLFSGRELINIGIGIERNGAVFYDSLAESTEDSRVKAIYKDLAGQEREHIGIFENMLSSLSDYQPPETLTDEYEAYMKALVDSLIFTDDKVARDMARGVASAVEAIQIALGAEKDSILFYTEMRELVRSSDRDAVGKLIAEEKSHLRQLTALKHSLTG